MATLYAIILPLHVSIGLLGLVVFWAPIATRKGSKSHRRYGRLFVTLMTVVALSGAVLATLLWWDPLAIKAPEEASPENQQRLLAQYREASSFLLLLAILLLNSARQATETLRAKADRQLLRSPVNLGLLALLLVTASLMSIVGLNTGNIIFIVFSGIAMFVGLNSLWYAFKPTIKHNEWLLHHVGNTLGAGIAAHTAFFVFGARTWMSDIFPSGWHYLPWLVPSVIGGLAIAAVNWHLARSLLRSQTEKVEGGKAGTPAT